MAACSCCGCVFIDSNTATIDGDGSAADAFSYSIIDPTFWANRYAVRRQRSTNQSINNNTLTPIDFTTAVTSFNRGFTFTAPSTFVFPVTGLYILGACVSFADNNTGTRYLELTKNGAIILDSQESNSETGASHFVSLSTSGEFNGGETIQVQVRQASGGALNVLSVGEDGPVFWAIYWGKFV